MADLSIKLSGLTLTNPIIPASGTFGYGREFAELYDINILGSFSFKGTTLEPRIGNETPRIAETASGMLNSVGLQNPGLERVISEELPNIAKIYNKPVVANISGFSIDEYVECARRLSECENVGILEINISCPNVHGGGLAFGTTAEGAASVTKAVKKVAKKPVYVKLSPNVTDIAEIAKACEYEGADGICLINTLLGMRIDIRKRKPVLANKTGGLSGRAIFPVALAMVYKVYNSVHIPIIGMGGIARAEDVIEMMLAGASAVEIGAANLREPFICKEIITSLEALCDELGIERISDIIGEGNK